ncbi:MAG: YciI family protein [Actinomycetes bacterium]
MPYIIEATDKPDSQQLRQQTRPEHLAYLERNTDRLLLAGAKWTDDEQRATGSVLIVDVDTREEAESFAANDPFARAGVFAEVAISRYRVAFLDRSNRLPA